MTTHKPGALSRRQVARAGLGLAEMGLAGMGLAGMGLAGGAALASAATAAPAQAGTGRAPVAHPHSPPVHDRLAIEDLFTRYLWAYDCTDEDEFLSLFTADALVVGKGTRYSDRAAILGWFRYLIAMREREGDDIWMHEAGQFRFLPASGAGPTTAGPDRWIVHAYATHFSANTARAVRGVRSLGYFTCECVREGAYWKFRRFSISPWDRTKVPWKKPLPWDVAPT